MKAFNDLADFSNDEIAELIALAKRLDESPEPEALKGKVLSLLFLSPSLRTLASFQAAMVRLGGGSFVISPDMSIHGLEVRDGIVMDGVAADIFGKPSRSSRLMATRSASARSLTARRLRTTWRRPGSMRLPS